MPHFAANLKTDELSEQDLLYTTRDEWCYVDGDFVTIGLTGNSIPNNVTVRFCGLPDIGQKVTATNIVAKIGTTTKDETRFDYHYVRSPVSGEVVEINSREILKTRLLKDFFGEGWLFRVHISNRDDLKHLITFEQYMQY